MQSGFPHSLGVSEWPQNNNETPVAVVHSASGIQANMVANQYPRELGVAHHLEPRQQGYTQTQQKFHRSHQQQRSPANPHNPKPLAFSIGTSSTALEGNSLGQDELSSVSSIKMKRHNPLLYAVLKENHLAFNSIPGSFSTQSSSPVETNANIEHNSLHSPAERHNTSQQVKCSLAVRQNLDHSGNSDVASDQPPPTDEQILNFIEKRLECYRTASAKQSRKYCATPFNENWTFCANRGSTNCNIRESSSVSHYPTTSFFNKDNVNFSVIEQYTASGGQALQKDNSKSSTSHTALTVKSKEAGDTVVSDKHSTGTITPAVKQSQHAPKNESVNKNASVDYDFPIKKPLEVTMLENVDGKLVDLDDCGNITFVGSNDEKLHSKWNKYVENDMATLHYSLTALKELIASLENVEIGAKVDNFFQVILQQYWNGDIGNVNLFTSTEYPQIMTNVAATCTKNEDESPVVLTAVSGMAFDEPTKKHPSRSLLGCSSPQEEYRSSWLNINKNLDDIDKMFGVSWALKSTTVQEKKETGPKAVEAVRLGSVRGVTDVPEKFQSKLSSVESENNTFHSLSENQAASRKTKKNPEDPQHVQIPCKEVEADSITDSTIQVVNTFSLPASQSHEDIRKDADSVPIQSDLSVEVSENTVKEKCTDEKAHPVSHLKVPQYEDISEDEDTSLLVKKQPCVESLKYEDISEDEDHQLNNMVVETTLLTQVPENGNKQSTFEKAGCGYVLDQAEMEGIPDERLIPKKEVSPRTETVDTAHHTSIALTGFSEPDDGFKHQVLSSPKCDGEKYLEGQKNQSASGNPSSVLKDETNQLEDNDENHDEWIVIPVSLANIEFEPEESDKEQKDKELVVQHPEEAERWCVPSPKPHTHQPTPEPEPGAVSCHIEVFDTLDSYLIAKSEQFGFCKSTPLYNLDHETQNRIVSCSEAEDSCETEDSCDYSSASEHNYLTVPRRLLEDASASVPTDWEDSLSEKEIPHKATNTQISQTRGSRLRRLRELLDARARSKRAQHKTKKQKVFKKNDVIVLDSDTDNESDQSCKEAKRKRLSSDSEDSGNSLPRSSERLIETKPGPVKVEHDNNRPNISIQEGIIILDSDMEDESDQNSSKSNGKTLSSCSVDGGSTWKAGQPTEAKGHIQQETNRLTALKRTDSHDSDKDHICKKKPTMEKTLSSRSDDSSTTSVIAQHRPTAEAANRSYETTSEKKKNPHEPPQCAGKNADSNNEATNPVIARLLVEKPSQSSSYLKLSKEPKGRLGKDEAQTVTASSEKTVLQDLYMRDEKDPCVSRSASGNDTHCAANNKHQASLTKPRAVSRQVSWADQQGPSTSIRSSASTSGHFSGVRQRSASEGLCQFVRTSAVSDLSKSKPSTLNPAQLKRSHSYSNATITPSYPATAQSLAKKRLRSEWHDSYVPTGRGRNPSLGTEEPHRTVSCDLNREARPRPSHKGKLSRQRHSSHKSATPLMKKTKLEAIQRTKDINRITLSGQRNIVGKDYKWGEKQRLRKVASSWDRNRCRSPARPHK